MVDDLFVYSFVGIGLGIFLFTKGFIWFRQARLIENMPTSKVRSIAMGLVEICGQVVAAKDRILSSPFSCKPCVHYRYSIEEYRQQGKHSRWVTLRSGHDETYFFLRDDTGSVLVDPKGASINAKRDFFAECGRGTAPPLQVQAFLKREDIDFRGWLGAKKMRFAEYYLEDGDSAYILGTAADNPFVADGSAVQGVDNVIIEKGKNDKFYYISDKPEREVLRELWWKARGGIFGGPALSLGCLLYILYRMGLL